MSGCIGITWPPLAAVAEKVCQRSLKRTSNGRPPYIYCWNLAGQDKRVRDAPKRNLKRTDSGLCLRYLSKLDNTTSLGSRAVKQNLRKLNLTCSLKQLDQILIGRRPGQLGYIGLGSCSDSNSWNKTHIANHDLLAWLRFDVTVTSSTVASTIIVHTKTTMTARLVGSWVVCIDILTRKVAAGPS